MDDQAKQIHSLYAQLNRLSERVETQARYTEVVERKLRVAMQLAGQVSPSVEIRDPILPLNGGVSQRTETGPDERQAYGARPAELAEAPAAPDESWWPRGAKTARSLMPNAGWQNYSLHGWVRKVVGISVCGLPRDILEGVVASIADQQARLRDFAPVFLTDSTDFAVFRRYGFVFEFLPPPEKQASYGGTLPWSEYAARRRALLEQKWGLDHVVCFGAAEFGQTQNFLPAAETQALADQDIAVSPAGRSPRRRSPRLRGANGKAAPEAPIVLTDVELPADGAAAAAKPAARRRKKQRAREDAGGGEAKAHRSNGAAVLTDAAGDANERLSKRSRTHPGAR